MLRVSKPFPTTASFAHLDEEDSSSLASDLLTGRLMSVYISRTLISCHVAETYKLFQIFNSAGVTKRIPYLIICGIIFFKYIEIAIVYDIYEMSSSQGIYALPCLYPFTII